MKEIKIKNFSKYPSLLETPDLLTHQKKGWKLFWERDLKELLLEISPIRDYSKKEFELWFLDYHFGEPNFASDFEAKENEDNYEAPLWLKTRLINLRTKEIKEQEIFIGNFPLMTSRGSFIINGIEKVVISQLLRSPGVIFFSRRDEIGKNFFEAQIFPNKGAWLEFITEKTGVIYARLNRRKKVLATTLLRALGLENDEQIREKFQDILKNGEINYIEETLKKDPFKTQNDALCAIYAKMKPGEMVSLESAKEFLWHLYFNLERFDLSVVGRWRLWQRLPELGKGKKEIEISDRVLSLQDIIAVLRELIRLNNDPLAKEDKVDHLSIRRIRGINELLKERLRIGFLRLARMIKDRMSILEPENITPQQLINPQPIINITKEFFGSSQLAQFLDNENPLSEIEHKRRLTATGPGGLKRKTSSIEVRDVQPSHFGKICPISTPEGQNIGLVNYLALFARVNEYGFLETPYLKVEKGVIKKDKVYYLNALEEENCNIAVGNIPYDKKYRIIPEKVEGRKRGEPTFLLREEIDFITVLPEQILSCVSALIPFLNHTDANRAQMGSNMQKQSVPLINCQVPLVMTGLEQKIAIDSGQVIVAQEDGICEYVDGQKIVIRALNSGKKKRVYHLNNFIRTNQYTCLHQKPLILPGQKVKRGDIIADSSATKNGFLSIGTNLIVAYLPWRGQTFEDSFVASERLVRENVLDSVYIENFFCDVRETKLGPEITTADIPNVSEKKLKNLDQNGLIRIGAEVFPGDILVGKISPKGEKELTPEEKLLKVIFGEKAKEVKDTSLRLEHGRRGKVLRIRSFEREKGARLDPGVIKRIEVEVAELRKIQVGDKLAGRYGNKGTISKILPIEEMPFLEDGTPVDLIISPLSVISRMNLGQLMEVNLGLAAKTLGYHAITPALSGATEEEIKEELKKAGFSEIGKLKLYDGKTGEPFKQPVTVGYLYTLKLVHMVADKFHARAIGPYSLITQQPVGGRAQYGGQRFGEMEVWALEGYGAANTLQEMMTIKSDDVLGRAQTYQAIIKGEKIKTPTIPASFSLLISELKALGLKVNINRIGSPESIIEKNKEKKKKELLIEDINSISVRLASPEEILEESKGEVTKTETINYRTQRPEKDGLFCERIFGPTKNYQCYCGKFKGIRYKGVICDRCQVEVTHSSVRRERVGHIKLAAPVAHIWFLRGIPSRLGLVLDLSLNQLEKIIYFTAYIIKRVDEQKRQELIKKLKEEYKEKVKNKSEKEKEELKKIKDTVLREINSISLHAVLSESEYRYFSEKYGEIFEAGTGAEALEEICKEIDLKKEIKKIKEKLKEGDAEKQKKDLMRLKVLQHLYHSNIRPEWMFLRVLPVLPPDLRPIVQLESGRFASSDLNDLYRRIINRNNRLKYLLEIGAPEIIIRNEKRMLQEAVDVLIDNGMRKTIMVRTSTGGKRELKSLASILEGKEGRFRQNLLGKRVDYSARSVIVAGPELKMNQVGLPKKMALEIFKPFVINKLLEREIVFNIREAFHLIDEETDEVWAILEEVVKDKLVLLNRAPTLHRLNIQAFYPVLIEGLAIKLHPIVCKAYNADFDGDQMAVFLPLSEEAQKEAREIMLSSRNLLKPATGTPLITVYQDIALGLYWLTTLIEKESPQIFSSFSEAILAYENRKIDLREKIKVFNEKGEILETSVGRIIFNQNLPSDFSFVNQLIKNKDIENIVAEILEKYPLSVVEETITKLKDLGIEYSTISGISLSVFDLLVPKEKKTIILSTQKEIERIEEEFKKGFLSFEEKRRLSIEAWLKAKNEVEKIIPQSFPKENSVFQIIDAKARGSWLQPIQMAGMKGMVVSPSGEIIELPILHSYRDGFTCLEYFISCHGARKGVTDKALSTAVAGYLTRRLIDVAHHVIIREKDCKDTKGIEISKKEAEEIFQDFEMKIAGRISLEDIPSIVKKGEIIDWEKAKKIAKNEKITSVRVRSPISCKFKNGVCQKCYGWDLGRNKLVELGEAVGIVAAQSIGEPGVQLTLRAFHVGGVVGAGYMISGLPRLNEIFEARVPFGKAIISPIEGKVKKVESEKIILEEKKSKKILEFSFLPGKKVFVKEGDRVKPGMVLTEGPLDSKEMYKFYGKNDTLKYLLKETQKIYLSQGALIHDKHIEVILKLMFSKARIIDSGDSLYSVGEIVDAQELEKEKARLKKENKNPPKAKEILLGISRAALNSTSFLSAASFQETSRVLISAALQGKVDNLEGLKENIIIGRKIPAGTGFRERFLKEMV